MPHAHPFFIERALSMQHMWCCTSLPLDDNRWNFHLGYWNKVWASNTWATSSALTDPWRSECGWLHRSAGTATGTSTVVLITYARGMVLAPIT